LVVDEDNLRRIAAGHGWPEDEFLAEVRRYVSDYGYSEEGALAQAQRHFTRKFGMRTRAPTLADFMPAEPAQPKAAAGPPRAGAEAEGKPGAAERGESLEATSPPTPERPESARSGETGVGEGRGTGPQKEEKVEIDPELSSWLVGRGFVRGPEGVAYTKIDRVGEDTVKLQVDFSDDPRGMRYGYRLNLQADPPEWKNDPALRDHPTLLEFKRFRDDLLARREAERAKLPPAVTPKPAEIPAKEGVSVALLPPREEEAEEEAREVERRDEDLIIREIRGDLKVLERALSDYFYSFELRGRRVIGLSYAGVKAIIRRMGHIEITDIKIEEKERSWFVLVKARDKLRDLEAYGPAVQPKHFQSGEENPFALTIAVSKAQRNAWRTFIDEKVLTESYRAWLEERGKREGGEK
jgi:hypothetical protein